MGNSRLKRENQELCLVVVDLTNDLAIQKERYRLVTEELRHYQSLLDLFRHFLEFNLEQSGARYSEEKGQVQVPKNKMSETSWKHMDLPELWDLFKESQNHLRLLERYMRTQVAESDILTTIPMCMCPISRNLVKDPVYLPCDCNCVYEREMLMQLEPPAKCPTCRAGFLPEQVQPANVLRDVINQLVELSIRGNNKHPLETLVPPPDAVAGGC